MNAVQRIVKNIGVTGLGQILIAVIAFFFMIYLARLLGEAGFGRFNFALSLTSLLVIFTDLGVNQLLIREIAREKELSEYYTNQAFLLKIPLAVLTFLAIVALNYLLGYTGELAWLLYLFGLYHILQILALNYLSLFQAWEKLEYMALFQVMEKLIIASVGIMVLWLGYGLFEIALVYLLAGIFDLGLAFILSFRKFIQPRFKIDLRFKKKLLLKGLPFGLNALFAILFFKIDTVLLAFIIGDVAAGIYNAAYNPLLSLSMIVGGMVSTAVYPVMSRQFKDSKHALASSALVSSKYLAIIGFPLALGSLVLAERFIQLFYAGNFLDSVLPFQILALFIPLRLISTITGTFLSSINRQGLRTFSVSVSALSNIGLNLVLIPLFSFIGASIATVASEVLLYFLFFFLIWRYHGFININKVLLKPILGSLVMAVVVYFIRDWNLLLVIILATLIYFISIIVLKTFTDEDKELFKSLRG